MARLARVIAPGFPHHVTQRGNRRQQTFFCNSDYEAYLAFMAKWCKSHEVEVWAYCLMPNHVHLICVPRTEGAMRLAIGKAHQCYTRRINLRERWLGHLWQGRFSSFVLGEDWLLAAVHYIERNPVKAGLVANATEWPWSSARAHVLGREDVLVKAEGPILEYVPPGSWEEFLSAPSRAEEVATLSRHGRTGRPLGDAGFVTHLEQLLGRPLARHKPGPKPGHCKGR